MKNIPLLSSLLPGGRKRRVLSEQARRDYANARGTAHLNLLRQAKKQLEAAVRPLQNELEQSRKLLAGLQAQKKIQLADALQTYIVQTRLTEVPGIGSKLAQSLTATVFRGNLRDLHFASRVPGIGQAKQMEINRWVSRYETQLPALLETDFPGKADILKNFYVHEKELQTYMQQRQTRFARLNEKLDRVKQELSWLESVSLLHFLQALEKPGKPDERLARYLLGVFPEWEPVPDWFKELLEPEKS